MLVLLTFMSTLTMAAPAQTAIAALLRRFESQVAFGQHSVWTDYTMSAVKVQIIERGRDSLLSIKDHLSTPHDPSDYGASPDFCRRINDGFIYLLRELVISIDMHDAPTDSSDINEWRDWLRSELLCAA